MFQRARPHLLPGIVIALSLACGAIPSGGSGSTPPTGVGDTSTVARTDVPPILVPDTAQPAGGLTLDALEPNVGRTAGAELVTITGTGFSQTTKVYFGSVPAAEVNVLSSVVIQVRTPAHAPGPVDVTAQGPMGDTARLDAGFKFKDAITVTSVEPDLGPREGGTAVTIHGEGFTSDTRVLIGGRVLVDAHVIDGRTLLGITPPGERAGTADVLAFTGWTNALVERAFRYTEAPRIDHIEPVIGSTFAATQVTLAGRGLPKDAVIRFGTVTVPVIAATDDGLVVRVPAANAGSVDVTVTTEDGDATAPNGFAFVDDGANTLAVVSMWPHEGPESGGTTVSLGLTGAAGVMPDVRFGSAPATVLSFDGTTLIVRTPAGVGTVDLKVDTGEVLTVPAAFTYRAVASIDEIAPSAGDSHGGETVVITGHGFPAAPEVFFGGLPAVILSHTASAITVQTPVGSPGGVAVRVVGDGIEVERTNGYTYSEPGGPKLYAIYPTRGAIAGGTLLRFFGSGFDATTRMKFANKDLPNQQVISSSEIRARSMKADEPATVDVKMAYDGATDVLGDAFTYFDPASPYGGSWGPKIHGTVNVTVLDITTTEPIPGAFVMLWSDPSTPYQGLADERGQIVFSGLDIDGPQMVTAAKQEYTAFSVVEYDAENVTVHLIPFSPPPSPGSGGGEPTVLLPARLEGRVSGLGKYVVAPPKPCSFMAQKGLVGTDGTSSCAPCNDAGDCGDGYQCFDIAGEGNRCARSCQTTAECPTGYACGAGVSGSAACIPDPGQKAAYCQTTHFNLWAKAGEENGPPLPHPESTDDRAWTEADGAFWINSRLGELSIVCLGGVIRDAADPVGSFVPLAMGVARSISAHSAETISDLEVPLTIPLRKDVPIRLDGAPLAYSDPIQGANGPTTSRLRVALDFGAEGFWTVRDETRQATADFMLDRQPENLTGALDGVTYTFLAEVAGSSLQQSGTQSYRVEVLDTDSLFDLVDGDWKAVSTGISRDVYGLWGTGDSSLWAVGKAGLIAHRKGGSWLSQFSPTQQTLRAVAGVGADFAVAVGDHGTAVIFDGVLWKQEPTGTEATLFAVCATAPYATFAVGEGVVLRRTETGWQPVAGAPATTLRGAYCPSQTELWAVGDDGYLWQYDLLTGDWASEPLTVGQGIALNAITARSPADVWIVGNLGTVLRRTGPGAVTRLDVPTQVALQALALGPTGRLLTVGARGSLLSFDGLGWTVQKAEKHAGDLRAVAYLADPKITAIAGGAQAVTLGPMLSFPEINDPGIAFFSDAPFGYHVDWFTQPSAMPTFNFIEMSVQQFPVWWTVIEASTQQVNFPNLLQIQGISPFPSTSALLTVTRILKPGVTVDNFDFWDTYDPLSWQSWSRSAVPIIP
jgi:hypothetical protein